jgi:DNA-binding response OmpR family regulator
MKRILVAEDSFALANLLVYALKNAGFCVDLHRTGLAASEAAEQSKYDLILLDQQMPKMTGLQVVERMRAGGVNSETPVILCTAKSHELLAAELMERWSIADVIHKPFSPKELIHKLHSLMLPVEIT